MLDILILFANKEETPFNETISPKVVQALTNELSASGYSILAKQYNPAEIDFYIDEFNPRLVFNMIYGYIDSSQNIQTQADVVEFLERLRPVQLNILGSSAKVQHMVQDKLDCANFLSKNGIKVPFHFDSIPFNRNLEKVIIKPRFGACHRGIKITTKDQLLQSSFDSSLLIQEYVKGREFTVGIIETEGDVMVFPPLEIIFHKSEKDTALGVNKKNISWEMDFQDQYGLCDLTKIIFKILNLRDYVRIDFRVGIDGPVCLDVNPLPNLDPENSFLPIIANYSGISYRELTKRLAETGLSRALRTKVPSMV